MNETEKAYIAGFLDGDGSIMALIEPHKECRFGYRIRIMLKFAQHETSASILRYIVKMLGTGHVGKSTKQVRECVIRDQKQIEQILNLLLPYVRLKNQQVQLALQLIKKLRGITDGADFRESAKIADKIANLNLRSRSRRKNTSKSIHLRYPRND
jgi:replication initiation and membrane attachment protein DnaB